jgi:hypothetical protein
MQHLTTAQKAAYYDDLLHQSDILQRRNSKLKSEYIVNVPQHVESEIKANNQKIHELVLKLEALVR